MIYWEVWMSNLSEKKIIQNIDELIDNCNCYLEDEETDKESIKWFKMEKESLERYFRFI